LDVFAGEITDAGFADNSFDIVTMWDVLEHVRDPLRVLCEVRRILRPGGLLLCSTPNVDSVDANLFGRYWIGYDFPRHLYVFSSSTLGRLLRQAGLHVEQFFCFYGRYTTFALSVSLWINAHVSSSSFKSTCRSILLFPLFRYLTLPYFYVLDKLGAGAILTVRARKPA
jgi:SAM-dependent methyltransferase